uniref:Lipase/esterase n=1 Tax=uncultured Mycolicibacterium sp. TaxID=2320817 RepID=A0A385L1D9_9MYCO|nr:lipase/esterase [uncultured Mycolicibacterium sp.]
MPVDQPTAAFLKALGETRRSPLWETPLAESRANMAAASARLGVAPAAVGHIADYQVGSPRGPIAIRVYTPGGGTGTPAGALLHFHGGGYVLGSLDSHDSLARHYCAHVGAVVISVDYHLAPEHRFPAQLHDAYAALAWVVDQASVLGVAPARIGVTGDSAGGNLAAALCLYTRAHGGPDLRCQALLYPATDYRDGVIYPSRDEFGSGEYFLSAGDMDWFRAQHLADVQTQAADPLASPMAAPDLSGLPPALVTTSGFDPLRDQGRAYAERLRAAGVPVTERCFDSTIHACASFAGAIPAGLEMLDYASHWLRAHLV